MNKDAMAVLRNLPAAIALAALLAGCAGTAPNRAISPMPGPGAQSSGHPKVDADLPVLPPAGSGRGGYYQDDGPGDNPPANLRDVPDAEVKLEPYSKYANRPYVVFGRTYTPMLTDEPFTQRGVASWYGKKFHGQRTSSGELYDMYKMSAAHPTLPIPSFARITSVVSGRSVIVRVNDRGPFHSSRIVDVSYTAALKLGLLGKGSHEVELERLLPADVTKIATARRNPPEAARPTVAPRVAALMLEDRMDEEGEAEPAPASQPAAARGGYYLQLGSYTRADKAAEARTRLMQYGGALATLMVEQAGSLHRLFSGPFTTRAEASKAAQGLPVALSLKPVVVKR